MTDGIIRIGIIIFKTGSITLIGIALMLLMNFIYSALSITINASVLGDLIAILQLWSPFNVGIIITWLITVAGLYLTYRLALLSLELLNKYFTS